MFAEFFTQMHWSVIMLLCISLVLLIVEAVLPGFGVCGISGIVAGIAAVVCEAVFTKSVFYVFFLILIVLVIFTLMFVIFSYALRRGPLKKTPLVESKSALPENYGKNEEFEKLIGKNGEVISACKPVGKAVIEGKQYTVSAKNGTINEGEKIRVCEIKNNTIKVELIKGGKDDE